MRLSATDLDAFRYWKASEHEDEDAALAALVAQLRKQGEPTHSMAMGKALHTALENAVAGSEVETLEADGFVFRCPRDLDVELPEVREIKATLDIVVDGVPVTLVGKVDACEGNRIDDHKATERYDPERFFDSYQWRVYLLIFAATHFRWNVFELFQGADWDPYVYEVRNVHRIEQHAYPAMREDVIEAVREFIEFARVHLPECFEVAEAA